jgi:hypothetical protein
MISVARGLFGAVGATLRGGALMEHRVFASAFGVLAAALVSVGPQTSAADPSGTQEKDDGWTKTAEAGGLVVPKMLRTAPPTASKRSSLGISRLRRVQLGTADTSRIPTVCGLCLAWA